MDNDGDVETTLCAFTCVANRDDRRNTYRTRYEFALGNDGSLTVSFNNTRILGGDGENRIDLVRLKRESVEHMLAGHRIFLSAVSDGIRVEIGEHGFRTGDFVIEPNGTTILANEDLHSRQAQETLRSLGFIQERDCPEIILCNPSP